LPIFIGRGAPVFVILSERYSVPKPKIRFGLIRASKQSGEIVVECDVQPSAGDRDTMVPLKTGEFACPRALPGTLY
jgi:hypothetical protein